ncbi:MAG: signal peptidase II [Ndongobacter sp.]|nr:signal peptidase II [Ndongobacter sp.]
MYSRKRIMRLIGAILGALFIIAADQLTKVWAVTALRDRPPQEIIGRFLQFDYIENRGAAFGILTNQRIFFIVLTLAIVAALIYFLFRQGLQSAITTTGVALIIGGAFGNFIDRLLQGYVVDFIRVDIVSFYEFPVFNVADIGVTVGCALLFVYFLWFDRKKEEAA